MRPGPVARAPAPGLRFPFPVWLLVLAACPRPPEPGLVVYAAVSLTEAVTEAARAFEDSTGVAVTSRFDASGRLATLIEAGAPADVFLAADPAWMRRLEAKNLLAGGSRVVAANRLVVVVPAADSAAAPRDPPALLRLRRVAVGDPATVPAGKYAAQALRRTGVWDGLEARLLFTPDVRGALLLAERGEVDAAVVYASDARADSKVAVAFAFPEGSHPAVVYPGAILRRSTRDAARGFLEFLAGPRGQAILHRHGFGS